MSAVHSTRFDALLQITSAVVFRPLLVRRGTRMSESHDDGEEDDEESSLDDIIDGQEIFESVDDDGLELLMKEAEQFCPLQYDNIAESFEDIDKLHQIIQQQQHVLMLSARIGQGLVSRTNSLMSKIKSLEYQLEGKTDQVRQLEYDKKKLREDLRSRLYDNDGVDSDGIDDTDQSSITRMSNCCYCSNDDQSDTTRDQIQRLEEENRQKGHEIHQLRAALESERTSAREDGFECRRKLDYAEAENRRLRDKLSSRQRKLELLEDELNESKNDARCLAGLLTKVEMDLEAQLNVYTREKTSLQAKCDDLTSRCDEYMAMYLELKTENASLRQRLKRRSRHEFAERQISVAQELDMTDNELSPVGSRDRRVMNYTSGSPTLSLSHSHNSQCMSNWPWGTTETDQFHGRFFSVDDSFRDRIKSVLGQPGRPGSHDLDVALLRLSIHNGDGQVLVGYSTSLTPLRNETSHERLRHALLTCESGRKSVDSGYSSQTYASKGVKIDKFKNGSWIMRSWRQLSTQNLGLGTSLEIHEGILVRFSVDSAKFSQSPEQSSVCGYRQTSPPSLDDLKESASISTCEEDFDASSMASGALSDIEDD